MRLHVIGALATGVYLAYLLALPAHTVHHLFEPGQSQADCAFASGADRTQGLSAATVAVIYTLGVEIGKAVIDQPTPLNLSLAPADARAPPLLAS